MRISGDVHDCQRARCNPDELHNNSQNLTKSSGSLRREGIEKRGNEEPLRSIPLPCFQGRAREKSLDDRNCLTSMTNHAAGIGTWTQVAWQFRVILIGDASSKIPWPHGVSELDCELPNRGLLQSEQHHARVAVDQRNRSSPIAGWPHHSEINDGQNIPTSWRIGVDDDDRNEAVFR